MSMVMAILPDIGLVVLAILVLVLDLLIHDRSEVVLGWVTAAGLLVIAVLAAVFARPGDQPALILGGVIRLDWASFTFRLIFLLAGALTVLFAISQATKKFGEFCALLIAALIGMDLMASASNLILLYLAIETTSLPLYILSGFRVLDQKSVEAGIKYLLYGAMTSAIMLYGFSLLYGFSGSTNIYEIAQAFQQGGTPPVLVGRFGDPGAGRVRVQGIGGAVPFLGARRLRRRADPGGRFPFHGFQSGRFCRAGAGDAGGFPGGHTILDVDHRGAGHRQHDRGEFPGAGAAQHQAAAGVFLDCPGGLHPGGCGRQLAARRDWARSITWHLTW